MHAGILVKTRRSDDFWLLLAVTDHVLKVCTEKVKGLQMAGIIDTTTLLPPDALWLLADWEMESIFPDIPEEDLEEGVIGVNIPDSMPKQADCFFKKVDWHGAHVTIDEKISLQTYGPDADTGEYCIELLDMYMARGLSYGERSDTPTVRPEWSQPPAQIMDEISTEHGVEWDTDSNIYYVLSFIQTHCDEATFRQYIEAQAVAESEMASEGFEDEDEEE